MNDDISTLAHSKYECKYHIVKLKYIIYILKFILLLQFILQIFETTFLKTH